MEFRELIQEFLLTKLAEQKSAHTVAWYDAHLDYFYRWLSGQITHRDPLAVRTIQEFYRFRRESGVSDHTIHGDHRCLRVFYRWLRDDRHLIDKSPVEAVRMAKPKQVEPRRANVDDYQRLNESIPTSTWVDLRDRLLISMLALSGIRVGEAVRVTVKDIDLAAKLLRVTGKTGQRPVPLLQPTIEAFIAYAYMRPAYETGNLFLSAKGDLSVRGLITPNGIRQMLRRRAKAAGLEYFNPHAYRHGLAMYLLNKGGDMSLVQKVLGHSRIATTAENYAAWLTEDMSREFAQKMGEITTAKGKQQ